jgi:2OG-Fe(II) oxygenase superfamily
VNDLDETRVRNTFLVELSSPVESARPPGMTSSDATGAQEPHGPVQHYGALALAAQGSLGSFLGRESQTHSHARCLSVPHHCSIAARPAVKPQAACPPALRCVLQDTRADGADSDLPPSDTCHPRTRRQDGQPPSDTALHPRPWCQDLSPLPHDARVVFNTLSAGECAQLRSCADSLGYSFWHPDAGDKELRFRNADTVEVTCPELAHGLWLRLRPYVTPSVRLSAESCERGTQGDWLAVGVNPVLLFSRYTHGGHFSPHTDGNTVVDFNHRSLYSVIVYLNTCKDGTGGTTLFVPPTGVGNTPPAGAFTCDEAQRLRWPAEWAVGTAPAQEGAVLMFHQDVPHEGVPVGPGSAKYIIRTDIMYQRTPPLCDDPSGRAAYSLVQQAAAAEADGDANAAAKMYRMASRECPTLAHMVGIA